MILSAAKIVCLLFFVFAVANILYWLKEKYLDIYYEVGIFFRSIKQEKK